MGWRDVALAKGVDQNNLSALKAAGITPTDGQFANGGTGGGGGSSPSFDYNKMFSDLKDSITGTIQKNQQANDARFAQNRSDLTNTIGTYKDAATNISSDVNNKYGIPDQVKLVNALDSRIQDLSGNLSGAGAGGYASGEQVDKALNTNYIPRFNIATGNLSRSGTAAAAEYGQKIAPYQAQVSTLNDQIAREATGYNNEQKAELDTLLGQLNSGVALSQADMARLASLAATEERYHQIINPGQGVVNTQNGAFAVTPPTYNGGGGSGQANGNTPTRSLDQLANDATISSSNSYPYGDFA